MKAARIVRNDVAQVSTGTVRPIYRLGDAVVLFREPVPTFKPSVFTASEDQGGGDGNPSYPSEQYDIINNFVSFASNTTGKVNNSSTQSSDYYLYEPDYSGMTSPTDEMADYNLDIPNIITQRAILTGTVVYLDVLMLFVELQ